MMKIIRYDIQRLANINQRYLCFHLKTLMEHDITLQFYRNNIIIDIYFIKKELIIHIRNIRIYI